MPRQWQSKFQLGRDCSVRSAGAMQPQDMALNLTDGLGTMGRDGWRRPHLGMLAAPIQL